MKAIFYIFGETSLIVIQHFRATFLSHKKSFLLFAGNSMITVFNFILLAFLSHILSVDSYGSYRQLLTLISIGTVIGSLGFSNALYYYLNLPDQGEQKKYDLLNSARLLVFTGAVLSVFLLFFMSDFLVSGFSDFANDQLFYLALVLGFLNIIQCMDQSLYLSFNKISVYFLGVGCSILLRSVFFIYGWLHDLPLSFYLWVSVWSGIFTFLFNISFQEFFLFRSLIRKIDWHLFRAQLKYAIPIGLGLLTGVFMLNNDRLVLSYFIKDVRAFAILSNGAFEVPLVSTFYTSFSVVAIPLMIQAYSQGNIKRLLEIRYDYIRIVAPLLFPFVFIFIFWNQPIITTLFGANYSESGMIFGIYSMVLFIRFCSHQDIFMVAGKTSYVLYIQGVEVIFNLLLNILFIYYWGIIGAPVAALCTNVIYFFVISFVSAKILNVKIFVLFPFPFLMKNILLCLIFILPFYMLPIHWLLACFLFLTFYSSSFFLLRKRGYLE